MEGGAPAPERIMEGGAPAPERIMEEGAPAPEFNLGEDGEIDVPTPITPSCERAVDFLRELKNATQPNREDVDRFFVFSVDGPNIGKVKNIINTKFNGTLLNARDIDYNDTESYLTELFQRNLNGEDSISDVNIYTDDTIEASTSRLLSIINPGDRVITDVICDPENTCTCTFSLEPTKEVIGPPPDMKAATKTG